MFEDNADGHTPTPLFRLVFASVRAARDFVDAMREAMKSPRLRRHTPPGPLVIYGLAERPDTEEKDKATLFVTGGILRASEMLGLSVPAPTLIQEGANAL